MKKMVFGIVVALVVFIFPSICIGVAIGEDDDYKKSEHQAIEVSVKDIVTTEHKDEDDIEVSAKPVNSPKKEEIQYPKQLIEMQDKYPETKTFVDEYAEKKDNQPAVSVGTVRKGEIPLLVQWDERWGYQEYGDYLMATDGCGPTCLSMVIVGLTGNTSITPYEVAKYAEANDYYEYGVGSKWTLMTEGAKHFGVTGIELPLYKESIFTALENNMPIICSVGPGDFTTNGHFIVLIGISDEKIIVNDPNSRANSSQLWDYERLASQIINLWAYVAQ